MSSLRRDDGMKSPKEGTYSVEGARVASTITAREMRGNASCEVRRGHTTNDGGDSITPSEGRTPAACKPVQHRGELHSAGATVTGGTRIRRLELFLDRLYQCAKADRHRVFHSLHDKLCSMDLLIEAWNRVAENRGVAGIDRETIQDIREYGSERYLMELQQELIHETYRVECVRRVFIPKPDGKQRPLGIPTVRDRIVQQAVKMLMEPIFETDFRDCSYGYRPNRSAKQASLEIRKYLNFGCTNVIDIDIEDFFGSIDHGMLISFVGDRIADPYILKLIREWLRAGVVHEGELTYPEAGTPQGGVISPLLANIYLNRLDTAWKNSGMEGRQFDAHLVRYADDILVLASKDVSEPMLLLKSVLESLKLRLSSEKSRMTTAKEGFDFLGFHFIRAMNKRKGKELNYFFPSAKSVRKFRDKVREIVPLTRAHRKGEEQAVKELNRLITGWTNYFNHTNANSVYKKLDRYLSWKATKYYCRVHKIPRVSAEKGVRDRMYAIGLKELKGSIQYAY